MNAFSTLWKLVPRITLRVRAWWQSLKPHNRHWLINIAIGVVIDVALHLIHPVTLENMALDSMMRVHALIDPAPPPGRMPPRQIFVNVDAATWRDKDWGGGEPYRAPREAMVKLIETAFNHGAQQVVLDILVEGGSADRPPDLHEDQKFADGLTRLLTNGNFGAGKQLVLVRSLRDPLQQLALDQDRTPISLPYPALSEVRESPLVDEVVNKSNGRMVVAAPYFVYSSDRVLRDWQLLKVVCQRKAQESNGVLRVVPSVQVLVATRHLGLPTDQMPPQPDAGCIPFPQQELDHLPWRGELSDLQQVADKQEHEASVHYWEALRAAVRRATGNEHKQGVELGQAAFHAHELGNRVLFRSGETFQSDPYFDQIPARLLLQGALDEKRLASMLTGRVAVIGQSYVEAGDRHDTPMGRVSGSVVLLNAIDSMVRSPLIQEPSAWITLPISFLVIVVVGYVFSRWNSARGPLISTILLVPVLAFASFYFFTYGVWLDFAGPLIGIWLHREYKSFEERVELRKLEQQHGFHKQH